MKTKVSRENRFNKDFEEKKTVFGAHTTMTSLPLTAAIADLGFGCHALFRQNVP